ncbi:hypothetical protein, partial [Pseudomonas sp. AH2 (2023)]|uniref:hypothetical protein n=1 Tax=Pseudomonas sp. AH2 (2023) TaxID=3048599 RepID=UPI002B23A662
ANPVPQGEPDERAVFEAGLAFGETPEASAADELLRDYERMILRDALREATSTLIRAERANDATAIQEASLRCKELQKRLAAIG